MRLNSLNSNQAFVKNNTNVVNNNTNVFKQNPSLSLNQLSCDTVSFEGRLIPVTSKLLLRRLKAMGATTIEASGSHKKVFFEGKMAVIPVHSGAIPFGTLRSILDALGLIQISKGKLARAIRQ